MPSRSGRFHVVFNGEIFNYQELAAELRECGHQFRGHSDTEVALAAFEQWGVERAATRFIGMFAMAVWDAHSRELLLVRDRLGIKPLFVYQRGGVVAFASEMKAFHTLPCFRPEIDTESLAQYFRYLYVPAPRSIFLGVSKLLPGHILKIRDPAATLPEPTAYWSVEEVARRERTIGFDGSDEEAVDELDKTLLEAVRLRMRADVPVGAFLSGGVDSSITVALMQEVLPRPVRTFTIGFDSAEHDESSEAEAVARHIGTDHNRLRLDGRSALDIIPSLPDIFDEPFANPSQLPMYLICHAARQQVTVAISGDGGDELFAGYNRYSYGSRVIRQAGRLPRGPRGLIGAGLTSVPPHAWDRIQGGVASLLKKESHRLVGEKAHKLGRLLRQPTDADMYLSLVSAWQSPPLSGSSGVDPRTMAILRDKSLSLLDRMMLADQMVYLPDDSLTKVDRTSMAVSLEVRVPILDHRVAELSWRLPERFKFRDGRGKWALRNVLARRVPLELIDRPKVGLSVPMADWLRGPLRGWAQDHLDPARLAEVDVLDVPRIQHAWKRLLAGKTNDYLALWTVLSFQAWRERWIGFQ